MACSEALPKVPKKVLAENPTPSIPDYIEEPRLFAEMEKTVTPALQSWAHPGTFSGAGHARIAYTLYKVPKPVASIVVLHGWTESSHQFREFIYYLLKNNFNVYTYDHRSHGESERLGIHPDQTHIESFHDYVEDLKIFMETIVRPEQKAEPLLLYAHSMGALIGIRYLETQAHPFQAAVLSTPMTEMANGGYPAWFVESLIHVGMVLGKAKEFCPGQGPFDPLYDPKLASTSSAVRHAYAFEQKKQTPALQSWGASYRWYYEGVRAAHAAIKTEAVQNIKIPILLFESGGDNVLGYHSADLFASRLADVRVVFVPNGKHLLYMERDAILSPYLNDVLGFFEEQSKIATGRP